MVPGTILFESRVKASFAPTNRSQSVEHAGKIQWLNKVLTCQQCDTAVYVCMLKLCEGDELLCWDCIRQHFVFLSLCSQCTDISVSGKLADSIFDLFLSIQDA